MAFKFTLPKAHKGHKVLAGKYHFKDGVMVVSDDVAKKVSKILRTYYACKVESVAEKSEDKPEASKSDASGMSKEETKR